MAPTSAPAMRPRLLGAALSLCAAAAHGALITNPYQGLSSGGEVYGVRVESTSSMDDLLGAADAAIGRQDWLADTDTDDPCTWYSTVGTQSMNGWYPNPLATGDHRIVLELEAAVTKPSILRVADVGTRGWVKKITVATTAPDTREYPVRVRAEKPAKCFSGEPTEFNCGRKIQVYPTIDADPREPTLLEKQFAEPMDGLYHNPAPAGAAPGMDYRGRLSTTISGETCQMWTDASPATNPFQVEVGASGLLEFIGDEAAFAKGTGVADHNFCRNPDGDPNGLWCLAGICREHSIQTDASGRRQVVSACKKYCQEPPATCNAKPLEIDFGDQEVEIDEPIRWVEIVWENPGNTYLALDAVVIRGQLAEICSDSRYRAPDCTACLAAPDTVLKLPTCQKSYCAQPGDCVYGQCADGGGCTCYPGFYGGDCARVCPIDLSKVDVDLLGRPLRPDLVDASVVCHGHGGCTADGKCECHYGYAGEKCERACPGIVHNLDGTYEVCSGRGFCDDGPHGTAECACDPRYDGDACERVLCNGQPCDQGRCVYLYDDEKPCAPGDRSDRCFCACKGRDYLLDGEEGYWAGASCDRCAAGYADDVVTGVRCSAEARSNTVVRRSIADDESTVEDERTQVSRFGPIMHELCKAMDLTIRLDTERSTAGSELLVVVGQPDKLHEALASERAGCQKTVTFTNPVQSCFTFFPLIADQNALYIDAFYQTEGKRAFTEFDAVFYELELTYSGACDPACSNGLCSVADA